MEIILSWLQYAQKLISFDGSQFAIEKVHYIRSIFNSIQSGFFCLVGLFFILLVCLFVCLFVFCYKHRLEYYKQADIRTQ